jgi:glycerol kinase
MRHVLALDQGTTSSRAIVFRPDGSVAGSAQEPFEQHFPAPGRVEHDAEEIRRTQSRVAAEAVARAGLAPADIAAVGITNQRETVVAWDRATGEPIGRAIVWQDRRTAADCERLRAAGAEPMIRERTGLLLDPYFSATKMRWMLDHVPGLRARAEAGTACLGTIDSWLLARLTGGAVHATDPTNAGRTLLFDLRRGDWDPELLELFGVPRACLPDVQPSASVFGPIVAGEDLAGIPIAGVAGDQQAALLGQGGIAAGDAKNTYGTGCFLLVHTGGDAPAPPTGILATPAASLGGPAFAREGSVFIGGALVQWLRDGLGIVREAADIESLAASVPDAGGVMLVPALAGLGAPWWDPRARGTILGLTRGTTRAHIARAALDGIAHSVADLLDAMTDATPRPAELRVDGAAAANDLLMQIQADLLGAEVVRPRMLETTALGAAILAAHTTGAWDDPLAAAAARRVDHRFTPRIGDVERRRARDRWRAAVDRSRDWERDADAGQDAG